MAKRKTVRGWRVMEADDRGLMVYFDPYTEHIRLFAGVDPELDLEVDGIPLKPTTAHSGPHGTQLSLLLPPVPARLSD